MADTGENREIKQHVDADQKEVVREMKQLVQAANMQSEKSSKSQDNDSKQTL